ncbi:hypothetical protein [Sinomonas humi]|uniref:Uncharacterized protein n=1 Tax=Sinomonas humi TaxID=1338436 RepID=A0A0B2AFH7_9MICC|nr:hypothetical protein [Sinomonas humi]KHL00427.1 hypothetical protein LK10_19640 [Sinomonas humi]
MNAEIAKALRGQLASLATREEVERLRDELQAELAESRAFRASLEKRFDDLLEADAEAVMPHSIAKRRAAARAAAMDLTL